MVFPGVFLMVHPPEEKGGGAIGEK